MDKDRPGTLNDEGIAALALMQEALQLLDRCDRATSAGAHLDLAICRLRDLIADEKRNGPRPADGRTGPMPDSGAPA